MENNNIVSQIETNIAENKNRQIFKLFVSTHLKLQIEPWAFDTLHEYFPETDDYDYRIIKQKLTDFIVTFNKMVSSKIQTGTEIMLNFMNTVLVFEVKSYVQSFIQNKIEEFYIIDLSRIENN